jgi:hypothetical protein
LEAPSFLFPQDYFISKAIKVVILMTGNPYQSFFTQQT